MLYLMTWSVNDQIKHKILKIKSIRFFFLKLQLRTLCNYRVTCSFISSVKLIPYKLNKLHFRIETQKYNEI